MAEPDMRQTWRAFLAALDSGDQEALMSAFDQQQRAFAAAVLALDVEMLNSNIDPAYELHNHSDFFDWRDVYHGVEGMMEWAGQITDTAGDFELVVERIEHSGDRLITLGEMHASGRLSQIEATFPWAQVWTLRGDKILRVEVYTDHERALEALAA
jgi:ketosteroid isomerase-like protein